MIIKSKKELYEFLPAELQAPKTKKLISKIFSIAASNFWTVDYDPDKHVLTFINEDDLIRCEGSLYLGGNLEVSTIPINTLLFKQSNKIIGINYLGRHCYLLTSDNKVLQTGVNDYRSITQLCRTHKRSDIVEVSSTFSNIGSTIINRNPDCFRKLEWNEAHTYAAVLCLKDCGIFTKGMIITTTYDGYFWQNYSPLELVNEGSRAGLYRINQSISCNLAMVTLEQLENIRTDYWSCSKGKFGCQRGCVHSCYGDSANSADKFIKSTLIKLHKEVFK